MLLLCPPPPSSPPPPAPWFKLFKVIEFCPSTRRGRRGRGGFDPGLIGKAGGGAVMNRGPAKQIRAAESSAFISGDCVIPLAFISAPLMKVISGTTSDRLPIRSTQTRVGLIQRTGGEAELRLPDQGPSRGGLRPWAPCSALLPQVHRNPLLKFD